MSPHIISLGNFIGLRESIPKKRERSRKHSMISYVKRAWLLSKSTVYSGFAKLSSSHQAFDI